jgi:hypothetical protein
VLRPELKKLAEAKKSDASDPADFCKNRSKLVLDAKAINFFVKTEIRPN